MAQQQQIGTTAKAGPKTEQAAPDPLLYFAHQLDGQTEQLKKTLPAHIPVERFKRVVMMAVQTDPNLLTADRKSVFLACQQAAKDGLLPDKKEGAMVIFNEKIKIREKNQKGDGWIERERWVNRAKWMPMIAGIRKMVRQSGEILDWQARVVFEKDEYDYQEGDDPHILHKPSKLPDRGKVVAAYSIAVLKEGRYLTREWMWAWEIEKVRAISKAKDSGPWGAWYEEMCKKTVARRHSKTLPLSTDLDRVVHRDDDLYDFQGAGDKAITAGPARPQLTDFTGTEMPMEIFTDEQTTEKVPVQKEKEKKEEAKTAAAEEKKTAVGSAAAANTVKADEDGVIIEFGYADAMELGKLARDANKPMRAPTDLDAKFHDAYLEGWRNRDEELAAEKKA